MAPGQHRMSERPGRGRAGEVSRPKGRSSLRNHSSARKVMARSASTIEARKVSMLKSDAR